MVFLNRKHAGQLLGQKLSSYKNVKATVLALPRGGVPVAAEVAKQLELPLSVLLVRKIGAPFQPEFAIGAICEDDEPHWNQKTMKRIGLEPSDMGRPLSFEREKIEKQKTLFRKGRELPDLHDQVVIIVDDGFATGATLFAAVNYLKKRKTLKIVIAVPVGAASTARELRAHVNEVIVVEELEDLLSVGQWYEDFTQVTDQEVMTFLETRQMSTANKTSEVKMEIADVELSGDLTVVSPMKALIVFAHGSGSSRKSPRNQQVASVLNEAGFGTLLFDLLTNEEAQDRRNVFNIDLLSERLIAATRWIGSQPTLMDLPIGYFGASTGAGAALRAASALGDHEQVFALVSRGGRPDLAGSSLEFTKVPALLIVGSRDFDVIDLNRHAQSLLKNSKMVLIPGATHLFEEKGTLEEASRHAVQWFEQHLNSKASKDSDKKAKFSSSDFEQALDQSLFQLKTKKDLDPLIDSIKNSRVVMLGEASHGTHEFYEMRSLISQRLIQDHGFKFIAVEGDWPDAYRIHRYIQSGHGGSAKRVLMENHRWPTWMWANNEIVKLSEWLKKHPAGFFGLDVYSLFSSIQEVVQYVERVDSELAREIERRYSCFDTFEGDEISYARSLLSDPSGCQNEAIQNLQKILEMRVEAAAQDEDELFSAQQNARVVANAESYYRSMLHGDASSWNLRDIHMMETLDLLLDRAGESAKAIVWAHNTHIGDYRATDMKSGGYVNLGGLARQSYGPDNVSLVGFGTYEGEVLASSAWGRPEKVMELPPARSESFEYHFHQAALKSKIDQFYLLLKDHQHGPLAQTLGHRAVGVVYDPTQEKRGNYVPTELSKRYDAFIFIDHTHALKSLHVAPARREFPETWPTGQ